MKLENTDNWVTVSNILKFSTIGISFNFVIHSKVYASSVFCLVHNKNKSML